MKLEEAIIFVFTDDQIGFWAPGGQYIDLARVKSIEDLAVILRGIAMMKVQAMFGGGQAQAKANPNPERQEGSVAAALRQSEESFRAAQEQTAEALGEAEKNYAGAVKAAEDALRATTEGTAEGGQ